MYNQEVKKLKRQCSRFFKSSGQCKNQGDINYVENVEDRGQIFFSLCNKHSPNSLKKNKNNVTLFLADQIASESSEKKE